MMTTTTTVHDLVAVAGYVLLFCPIFRRKTTMMNDLAAVAVAVAAVVVVEVMIDCPLFLQKTTTQKANP